MRGFFFLVFWCVLSNVSSYDTMASSYTSDTSVWTSTASAPPTPPPTPAPTSESTKEHRTLIIVLVSVSIVCLLLAFWPKMSRGSASVDTSSHVDVSLRPRSNPAAKLEEKTQMLSAELHLC